VIHVIESIGAGQELNVAQHARRQAVVEGCFGSALFLLSKVTAGGCPAMKGEGLHAND
jgi:hypothetical protein